MTLSIQSLQSVPESLRESVIRWWERASRQGTLRSIDAARVEETAQEISRDFRKHRIANLLKESIWLELKPDERRVLKAVVCGVRLQEEDMEAVTNLELLGVVSKSGDGYRVGARLLTEWVKAYAE